MESLWIIHFEDNGHLCMTEEAYAEFKAKATKDNLRVQIVVEEHWFDKRKAKEKYPWID